MTNLAGLPPQPKPIKAKPNPRYLAEVRKLPCIICLEWGMRQNSPTEAHHCKSGRYSQVRTPDEMAIALCHSHHHKLRDYAGDEDKIGFHNSQELWESLYGPDTYWIPRIKDMIDGQ